MPHVLIVDDEQAIHRILDRHLKERDCTTESAFSGEAGIAAATARRPDLVMLDIHMEGIGGMEALRRLVREVPGVPVVIMTGAGSIALAVEAFKSGAVDFIAKPFEGPDLLSILDPLLSREREGSDELRPTMVGESASFREAMNLALRFAWPNINILLHGETGSGKELFAKTIHAASKRKNGPFVAVDCGTLTENLIESALFGHEKGAFTGAINQHIGHFETAHGGTLFLDEIGNLPITYQRRLLRVIQERTLQRVGGSKSIDVDFRLVTATNVDLEKASAEGSFRSDLYYRIAETTIRPPPLRERGGDVEKLANFFVKRYARRFQAPAREITPAAMSRLHDYPFPGNVRELESIIKQAVILADDAVGPEHLPRALGGNVSAAPPPSLQAPLGNRTSVSLQLVLEIGALDAKIDFKSLIGQASEQVERAVLEAILQRRKYSLIELSELLDLDVKPLREKLKKHGLGKYGSDPKA
jgi:DNA-binding NtrC family response regulator